MMKIGTSWKNSRFIQAGYTSIVAIFLVLVAFLQTKSESQSMVLNSIQVWENDLTLALSKGDKHLIEVIGKTIFRNAVSYLEFRSDDQVIVSIPTLSFPEKCHFRVDKPLERYGQPVGSVTACFNSSEVIRAVYTSPFAFVIAFLFPILVGFVPFLSLIGYRRELFGILETLEDWNSSKWKGDINDSERRRNQTRDAVGRRIIELFEKGIRERLEVGRQAERSAAIAQMTQMLAHDVRKPFSSVKMVLSAMAKLKSMSEVKTMSSVAIPEINRSIETVNGLIQDVMEIGSDSRPVKEDVDICDLIDQALTDTFRIYPDSSVVIHYELNHAANLKVDQNKVLRVLSNIIGNGLQAMGFQGNLSLSTRSLPGATPMIEFTIANNGPHIPAEIIPRLFDAFFTSGKKGGTGLGLAIAHKIVTAHGGSISCKSEPGQGVAFVFTLPASTSGETPSPCHLSSSSADFIMVGLAAQAFDGDTSPEVDETILVESFSASAAQMGRKLVVLIADDERLYREGLVEKLERHTEIRDRLEILTATNPFEAIKARTSDLAIVDVDLGCQEMNGFDVVSQLRKFGNQGIVCTHSNRILASDHKTAIDHGADAFLPKPMSTVHLLKLLCQAVERVKEIDGVDTTHVEHAKTMSPEPLKFAFVDDSKSIRMTWKIAWKGGNMLSFGSPEEFWKEAEANPGFIESLACVITDFDFGSMSKENGGTFASQLRKRTQLPVFLASDGDYSLADFNGDIDAILPKQPISKDHLLAAIDAAKSTIKSDY
jgi:signal transduction histidine kinase/DNA-binding NarL/FixJ family response regulator